MIRLPRLRAAARLLALAGLAFSILGSAGCSRVFASYDLAPNGMPRRDDTLRQLLVSGRPDSALVRVAPKGASAPEDELLRSLYSGIVAHYGGSYDSSTAALERAADLAEDRYTKRISRAALSLVTNDMFLPYEPGGTERLLIHYYAALNFLRQDDLSGAAVEARRLSAILERESEVGDSTLHGWLRYFSGTIFEAAREWNDADVAYRNAERLLGSKIGGSGTPGSGTPGSETGSGEVVILVEDGFVAHRVEQAVVLPLYSFELDRLSRGDTGDRLVAAASVTTRVVAHALSASAARNGSLYYSTTPRPLHVPGLSREVVMRECAEEERRRAAGGAGDRRDDGDERERGDPPQGGNDGSQGSVPVPIARPGDIAAPVGGLRGKARPPTRQPSSRRPSSSQRPAQRCTDMRNPYILRIAWPVYRQDRTGAREIRVLASGAGGSVAASDSVAAIERVSLRTNLTSAVLDDFRGERNGILARTILRGVTKAAVTRRLEKAPGEDGAGLGRLLGAIFNIGSAILEQADTRSWQLLPDQLQLVRLRLPPGEHDIVVEVSGGSSGGPRRVELGRVGVEAGRVSFVSTRVWR